MKHKLTIQTTNRNNQKRLGNITKISRRRIAAVLMMTAFSILLFHFGAVEISHADTSIGNVPAGTNPFAVAVNPVTNKIYVANANSSNVTVIDGTNNSTQTVAAGSAPLAVAVNPVTNKIYVANFNSSNVTVIDGTNNSTQTVAAGTNPRAVAVNPITDKVYTANQNSNNVTVITPVRTSAIPLNTTVAQFPNNTAPNPTPTFDFTATSTYSPNTPPPTNIYFQIDTKIGNWTRATNTGSTATTLSASGTSLPLQAGIHTVFFYATDGSDATSINPLIERYDPFETLNSGKGVFGEQLSAEAPESSPIIGGINAMQFLVPAVGATAAGVEVSGRVLTANGGYGISQASVTLTNMNGENRTVRTNSFGYFRFDEVEAGQTYIVNISARRYQFTPQVLNITDNLTGLSFTANQ